MLSMLLFPVSSLIAELLTNHYSSQVIEQLKTSERTRGRSLETAATKRSQVFYLFFWEWWGGGGTQRGFYLRPTQEN